MQKFKNLVGKHDKTIISKWYISDTYVNQQKLAVARVISKKQKIFFDSQVKILQAQLKAKYNKAKRELEENYKKELVKEIAQLKKLQADQITQQSRDIINTKYQWANILKAYNAGGISFKQLQALAKKYKKDLSDDFEESGDHGKQDISEEEEEGHQETQDLYEQLTGIPEHLWPKWFEFWSDAVSFMQIHTTFDTPAINAILDIMVKRGMIEIG